MKREPPDRQPRVLHVITDLGGGGAELMLFRLLQAPELAHYCHEVISLTDLGPTGERLRRLGIRTRPLWMSRLPNPIKLIRLARYIREIRPVVVQTWMYHPNLLAGLAARLVADAKIVWGIHSSALDPKQTHRTTLFIVGLCARLSHWIPDRIVAVSRTSREHHVAIGYDANKFVVVPNGFDLQDFRPDPASRADLRKELGVGGETVLIGLVARTDPVKDHLSFVRAAALLAARHPRVHFLLCGHGTTAQEAGFFRALREARLLDRFHLLGPRNDVPRVMNALDISTLCSASGEAFPLVIGEAMACGVPCVVTDLGDCAYIVGQTGRVVPPRNPDALARAWEELIDAGPLERRRLGREARRRIETRFGLSRVAAEYATVYREVLGKSLAGQALPRTP